MFVASVALWDLIFGPGGKRHVLIRFHFCCLSDISIFVALVALWGSILDTGGKSDALIRLYKIQ